MSPVLASIVLSSLAGLACDHEPAEAGSRPADSGLIEPWDAACRGDALDGTLYPAPDAGCPLTQLDALQQHRQLVHVDVAHAVG